MIICESHQHGYLFMHLPKIYLIRTPLLVVMPIEDIRRKLKIYKENCISLHCKVHMKLKVFTMGITFMVIKLGMYR